MSVQWRRFNIKIGQHVLVGAHRRGYLTQRFFGSFRR